ncbi:LOW QUALITY PROTEIN: WD repeat-containing protein 90 [Ctenodactylus gundi]
MAPEKVSDFPDVPPPGQGQGLAHGHRGPSKRLQKATRCVSSVRPTTTTEAGSASGAMAGAWQRPLLNVFRHFKVDEWRRSSKEGDVAVVLDKTLRCPVYRIRGSAAASNYIQLPRTSTQSLGLTGRYLYVLFRPVPTKHFVIHLDVSTEDGQVIRVSFSSLFKEFKSSATWLQFPFVFEARPPGRDLLGVAPSRARWTCLQLDLCDILRAYLSRCYGHLKGVRLCASLLVKSLYTSDLSFDPAVTATEARRAKLPVTPVPREMAFPVPKGERWHDRYVHVQDSRQVPTEPVVKSGSPPAAVALSQPVQERMSPVVWVPSPTAACQAPPASSPHPEVGLPCKHSEVSGGDGTSICSRDPLAWAEASDRHAVVTSGHRLAHESTGVSMARQDAGSRKTVLPDPVLRLKGVIGFGGHSTKWALWTKDGAAVVYPCHAVITVLHVDTGEQRVFLGHTDKVSALALDGSNSLLASAQVQPPSVLRLWDFPTGQCLSLFRSPVHSVRSLSFSSSGALLCGVGKDCHGRTVVVAWGTCQVGLCGEVVVLAKVHTDFDIQTFQVAVFDETRMASCGRGSVRLWRLRGGALRSCPVNLGEYSSLELTDLAFAPVQDSSRASSAHTLYVCSRSGHIFEIDLHHMTVLRTRCLQPAQLPGRPFPLKQAFSTGSSIAISSLSVSATACAMGSEDGYLRLWPLDFSSVLLEAEHEGPVSAVCISPDGLRVLSTTASGHLGFLHIPSQEYTVLVRSHTAPVVGLSVERSRGQLATVSLDSTVRIWDLATLRQLYDFTSSEEAPCAVTFHPTWPAVFCGFSSGAVRALSLESARVLVEHSCHQGAVTSLVATPDGNFLFSACSQGSLAQYGCIMPRCHVLRVAANVVHQGIHPGPGSLAVSKDSRLLAFVGPSKCIVTVLDSASLDKLLQVNISTLDPASDCLDSAVAICFDPRAPGQLLVSTSNKVVAVDAVSGHTVHELPRARPMACASLALSTDGHLLLVASGQALELWDYSAQSEPSCQVYVGHSEPVQAVAFTADQQQVLSVGDAIFLWDVLATSARQVSALDLTNVCQWLSTPMRLVSGQLEGEGTVVTSGPGPGQLEDADSGASGLPRQQVPVPSQASPPQLGVYRRLPKGSDDEGRPRKASGAMAFHQVPGPPVHVERAPSRTGNEAEGITRSLWGRHILPGARSTGRARAQPPTRPDSYKHFIARYKASALPRDSCCPAGGERLHLKVVVGYNGNGRANMVWRPDTGFFTYTCGRLVVVEDLHSGSQQHWLGHPEEISTLALSHDAQVLASASCRGGTATLCQIRLWAVPAGVCQHLFSHHSSAVQALAFSPDDEFLLTLGDYLDRTLALWSMATYELILSTRLLEPVHDVAFDPWDSGCLTCVGTGAVTFWLLQRHGGDISLQSRREPVPEEMGVAELTSLCYGAAPLLFCGSSSGYICVWDTGASRCLLAWEADDGEIGVLLCSGSRLVSGSNTRRLRLWAVGSLPELRSKGSGARSNSVLMECELTLDGAVVSASFDSSVGMGIVGTTAGTLWYISWAERTSTRLISGHRSKVNEVVFSPSESHCATCSEDGSVRVWSLASMELVIQFQVLNQSCLCLAWSPQCSRRPGQQRVAAGYSDGTLRLFSVSRTTMEVKMRPHRAALTAVAFSPDGQTVLSGDKAGFLAVSRPCTGMTFHVLSDHRGAPISTIQSTRREDGDLSVQGADLWLAASEDQRVSVWASDWPQDHCVLLDWLSFPSPAMLQASDLPPPSFAAFCPWDPTLLVCMGLGICKEVFFYSLRQKQVVQKIPLPFFAMSLSLSPGACLMAVGFAECMLRLVDCVSGTAQDFAGHDDSVHLCRFSPSARLLFTASHSEILVWDVLGP